MNRILTGMLMIFIVCYSGICFGSDKAASESQPSAIQGQTNDSKNYEKKYGPFNIGGSRIVVVNKIQYVDSENIEDSFEIKNAAGLSYYKGSHMNDQEGGTTLEGVYKLEGKSGEGLILYFDTTPSAPNSGKSFQIFGVDKGEIKPLSPEINISGIVQSLKKGETNDALRLVDGNQIKIEQRKDLINVIVPLLVDLQKLTIVPLMTTGVFDINIGTLNAPGTENRTDIKFYQDHNVGSKITLIKYGDVKKVEFINAFADVQLNKQSPRSSQLDLEISDLWLRVKINDREGWVHDADSLVSLGIPLAG